MSYLKYINMALEGAKYHENQAFSSASPKKKEYKKMIFYLRAYFWELLSVWDYILQQTNIQTLKLSPFNVRRDLLEKIEKKMPEYKYLVSLKNIENHDRMKRIILMRDYAHKWQYDDNIFVGYDLEENVKVISLNFLNKNEKNLPKQINIDRNDLWFINKNIELLINSGFFKE